MMLRRSFANEPKRTLSFLDIDDQSQSDDENDANGGTCEVSTHLERHKSKTEKSVHFAVEESIVDDVSSLADESLNDTVSSYSSQASHGIVSWLPSEHLYSEDTFIQETETTAYKASHDENTSNQTGAYSYGSSTFILPNSDEDKTDNTDTEQIYSYTDSFMSSDVFSTQSANTGTYREWKDITEIVKDIEELEESEFVTRADSIEFQRSDDDTDISDTYEAELVETARYQFVKDAIHLLKQRRNQSSLDSNQDLIDSDRNIHNYPPIVPRSIEEKLFRKKMIQRLKKDVDKSTQSFRKKKAPIHLLYTEVNKMEEERRKQPLEFYGLNSAIVERLKLDNLQCAMDKKSKDLDKETKESEKFINNTRNDETLARDKFVSQVCAQVRRENMEDAIQTHLIKMNPVTKFAEFVRDLPRCDEDVREILYDYRRQLEHRKKDSNDR